MSFPERTPAPPSAPFGHPSTWPAPGPANVQPPKGRTAIVVVGATLGVLALVAAVGIAVYLLDRGAKSAAPAPVAPSAAAFTASGALVLKRGEFSWNSAADPTCQGLNGYSDLRGGAQVTVTDATGKKIAIGVLAKGNAGDFSTEADGTQRAASCSLPFAVTGVPRGVGPYGIEISHRGVQNYNEAQLDSGVILGFG